MTDNKFSNHFTLDEFTKSIQAINFGIDNTPDEQTINNLERLVMAVLQPVRVMYGKPIIVNSGYRCPELNRKVGGSPTSQHMTGQAADIQTVGDKDNKKLFQLITTMDFDQLIWEHGDDERPDWIHVSYVSNAENRHCILRSKKLNKKTIYLPFKIK